MSIQWYPGHMTKARRELAAKMPSQDVIIEVLDARMPRASENPVVAELRGDKPCVKVLTKSDLADPAVTAAWKQWFETKRPGRKGGEVLVYASSTERPGEIRKTLPELCKRLVHRPQTAAKPVRVLVVGIPNVGKSTLINTLMHRPVAPVSDKPAVTKVQQLVTLKSGMVLLDTPGILWPKIEDARDGLRLALGGTIPPTAIDYLTIAMFAAELVLDRYWEGAVARYKLTEKPPTAEELITAIGRKRGCLRPGALVDMHKASEILVHEIRAGLLGRISFEAPPGFAPPEPGASAQ